MSIESSLCQSVNPLEHNYARVLDLQLNAKLKKQARDYTAKQS